MRGVAAPLLIFVDEILLVAVVGNCLGDSAQYAAPATHWLVSDFLHKGKKSFRKFVYYLLSLAITCISKRSMQSSSSVNYLQFNMHDVMKIWEIRNILLLF